MASTNKRTNTPTEQNKEDNALVLYRLTQLEAAVKDLGEKFDKQDNIKKSDLIEFRDAILARFNEKNEHFQQQIDSKAAAKDLTDLEKNFDEKVADIKKLIYGAGAFFLTILGSVIVYYLTNGAK